MGGGAIPVGTGQGCSDRTTTRRNRTWSLVANNSISAVLVSTDLELVDRRRHRRR
jgi:hypothetical protein